MTAYNKAKSSTGVATISINTNKTKAAEAATISANPRNTSRANVSLEDDGSRKAVRRKPLTWERVKGSLWQICANTNKNVVTETGDIHQLAVDELYLYGGSDLDEQIDELVNTNKSPKVNFAKNNDESAPEECDEDELLKDIGNDFSIVEKTGPPIGKNC